MKTGAAHERRPGGEIGNMLLFAAAVAQVEGNADFAGKYWPLLTRWAEYRQACGKDPENQLCTDDFAGHLARNANLAAKAICALGACGMLATMRGDQATGRKYLEMAGEFAIHCHQTQGGQFIDLGIVDIRRVK